MPRVRHTRNSSILEDEFVTPEPPDDQTDYGLEFTNEGPSTSRAAASLQKKYYARKSTAPHPHREISARSRGQTGGRSSTQQTTAEIERPATKTKTRKQTKPKSLYDRHLNIFREVKRLQSTTDFLIPKLSFGRLVREIILEQGRGHVTMITKQCLEALQEATEMYVTQVLSDAYLLAQHRQRATLTVQDIEILRVLKLVQ